ncbi:YecA family protein [Sporosarcina koreensis]|uniref:YecA family protein n=1 Tax=Sporosarcina koreensis TaxID=334735 RepID=A0ABW0U484_9BACL
MIGRNDPCPCGSGKKYKRCCASKTGISNEQLVDEELRRIISGYFENGISLPAEFAEYDRYERQWRSGLGRFISGKEIGRVTGEYYLFIARRDLWRSRVLKELDGTVRSDTRRLLQHWNDPIVLLAKVKGFTEDTVTVEQILDKDTYILPLSPRNELKEGDIFFGIALYDDRKPSTNAYLINGLYRVSDQSGSMQRNIVELAESSGFTNSFDFYNEHMLDVYKTLLSRVRESDSEEVAVPDIETSLTEPQREVLEIAFAKLDDFQIEESMKNRLKNDFEMFCLKEEPIIRKPEVLAASLFKTAHEIGMLGDVQFTQTDAAKLFGVSVSAMMKNVDTLTSYVAEVVQK